MMITSVLVLSSFLFCLVVTIPLFGFAIYQINRIAVHDRGLRASTIPVSGV